MKLKARRVVVAAALSAFAIGSAPAAAERLYTYWKLEASTPEGQHVATYGTPFLEQRLLPVRLVELQEPIFVERGNRTIEKGTLLYLVFNKTGTLAYCTSKDFTKFGARTGWGIPIADTRPCFLDADNDGRFEAAFFVFDEMANPPTARGSTNKAKPVAPAAYIQVDPHRYRSDLKLHYTFEGSKLENTQIAAAMDGSGADFPWARKRLIQIPEGYVSALFNTAILVRSVEGKQLTIEIAYEPEIYVYSEGMAVLGAKLPEYLKLGDPPDSHMPAENGTPPETELPPVMELPPIPTETPPDPSGADAIP